MELAQRLRPSTIEDAVRSYRAAKHYTVTDALTLSTTGLAALDHFFFGHRLSTKTKRHLSFVDAMSDDRLREHLFELVRRYRKVDPATLAPPQLLRAQYNAFSLYYGTMNQF